MKKRKSISTLVLSLCLMLGIFSACSTNLSRDGAVDNTSPPDTNVSVAFSNTYSDIYKALSTSLTSNNSAADGRELGGAMDLSETAASDEATAAAPDTAVTENSDSDYSNTNVQVDGIDEGDIVKTDGSYIYILHDSELIIMNADGAETAEVYRGTIAEQDERTTDGQYDYSYEYPYELYITGNYLIVLSTYSDYTVYETDSYDERGYQDTSRVLLDIYDVSNPESPKLLHQLGQDGSNIATRLVDNTLYLISAYYVYDINEDDPGTFIPSLYQDGVSTLISEDCIGIMPYYDSTAYTILSAYDIPTGTLNANQTVLGGGSTVYMNHENIYVAVSTYDETASAPYTDSVYTVIDYTGTNKTAISRFDISGNGITLASTGTVNGNLNNQFAMDENDGNLRLVTTTYSDTWSVYTDDSKGWEFYDWSEDGSQTSNALYVLDSAMNIVGSVTDLASDEVVYSVRFDGNTAYFVTFRTIDPLFAVDLSNPTSPKVLSTLKIAGFSQYLHLYSDDRLFGLGMDADEETGMTDGMKLTMFDTKDPANVTEKHTLLLDSEYSTALYNHKAILIDRDKNIIAFPVEDGYAVYGYSDDNGFYLRAHFDADSWYGDARGLYIGNYIYIVSYDGLTVLDMNNFTEATNIEF